MKRQGPKDFATVDAFSVIKENKFLIECNYCDFFSEDEEQALQHYDDTHKELRDKSYPKTYLDKFTGKKWFVPKLETIEHNKYMIDDVHFYLKFYGSCTYDEQMLSSAELKNVRMNTTTNHYYYKEDDMWDIGSQQKQKNAKKQPKEPQNVEQKKPVQPVPPPVPSTTLEEILKRLDSLEQRINRMSSQPKSAFSPRKEWRIYSLNVGESKVENSKKILKDRYNITDDFIRVKKNSFGNFSIHYKLPPKV